MRRVGIIGLLVLASAQAWAWGDLGHQTVSAIAWRRMDQATKVKIAQILMRGDSVDGQRNNETYTQKLVVPTIPESLLTTQFLDEFVQLVFVQSSTWPDEIKRGKSHNFDTFIDELNSIFPHDHIGETEKTRCKSWHYLDLPIVLNADGTITEGKIEQYPYSPSSAVSAMNEVVKPRLTPIPNDGKTTPDKRAVYLFFANHIVGDLHQPLHCVSLYGTQFPKLGDAGGNLFTLKGNSNLHRIWDSGIEQALRDGGIERKGSNTNFAIELAGKWIAKSDEQPRIAQVEKQDPMRWVVEGRDLAISVAYQGIKMGDAPSPEYLTKMGATSKSQAILAGYRLADYLKNQLK
ncbi:MAG: S1/P1 nuclease [Chthonomonas sp.]|nr:S1/P1 nuclease [Chthonomonas sp.]